MRPQNIVVLGSTGSIGTQALDIARSIPDAIQVAGLAAGGNTSLLARQIAEFRPSFAVSPDLMHHPNLLDGLPCQPRVLPMTEMVAQEEVDLVLIATVGSVGLLPTLAALRAGKRVALANKEVLVMAGHLIMNEAARSGAPVLPIDSEHSAIWQCLRGEGDGAQEIERLILTASGGALRDVPLSDLSLVTPAEALRHPTWTMGPKVTIDSATLLNKGLEIIEAHWLFGVDYERIDVVMHRESMVHSLVEFVDGSMKAQLGAPDMRAPIQYALTYPRRLKGPGTRLDLTATRTLTFEPLDIARYPCLRLAREAALTGGTAPAVLAASADVAVQMFLAGSIVFSDIASFVENTLEAHTVMSEPSLEQVLAADAWAREYCRATAS